MERRDDVNRLCVWVRRVISSALALESLRLICNGEQGPPHTGASVSFDSLTDHLEKKHHSTLRFLYLTSSFVCVGALRGLCGSCVHLEELELAVGENALRRFAGFASNMRKLHTVSFDVRNVRQREFPEADEILRKGPPGLRRLSVNGMQWEGSWESERVSEVKFEIRVVDGGKH